MGSFDDQTFEFYRHGLATGHTYWTVAGGDVYVASGYIHEDTQRLHFYVGSADESHATEGLFTDGVKDAVKQMEHLSDSWHAEWRPHVERLYRSIVGDKRELEAEVAHLNEQAAINANIIQNLHAQLFELRDKLRELGQEYPAVVIEEA